MGAGIGLLVALFLAMAAPAPAQQAGDTAQPQAYDLGQWEEAVSHAQAVLAEPSPSEADLDTIRTELARARGALTGIRDDAEAQVAELRSTLAALGDPPADGADEPAAVAERRADLNRRIGAAMVPVLQVQDALAEIDKLSTQVESLLLRRFSDRLTTIGPSPLLPSSWEAAARELGGLGARLHREAGALMASDQARLEFLRALPVASLMILAGLGLLLAVRARVSRWMIHTLAEASTAEGQPQRRWTEHLLPLARLAIPAAGAALIIAGLGMVWQAGALGLALIDALPAVAAALILAYGIGTGLFEPGFARGRLIPLDDQSAGAAARTLLYLGLVWAANYLLDAASGVQSLSNTTRGVVDLPLILAGALLLYRLVRLVQPVRPDPEAAAAEPDAAPRVDDFGARLLSLSLRMARVVSILAPVAAVAGFASAARYLLFSAILTLALAGGAYVLFRVLSDAATRLTQPAHAPTRTPTQAPVRSAEPVQGLLPVLFAFLLVCASLPVLALIWGAGTGDILAAWTWLSNGFTIGDNRISLTDVLSLVLVFGAGYALTRALQSTLRRSVLPRTRMDVGARNAVLAGVGYVGIFLAAVLAISSTGLDLSNLAIVAGALSVGIGFGLQTIVSNFVSGIILLVERPIKEGDWIEVAGFSGNVSSINVRSTKITTFDRATVIVPNQELIAGTVLNRTLSSQAGRLIVPVGVAYGTDPRQVERILLEIAREQKGLLARPAPFVVFRNFGASSLDFELRCVLRDVNNILTTHSDINYEIARRFAEEGIEIPFAQTDVTLRNVAELVAALGRSPAAEEAGSDAGNDGGGADDGGGDRA